MSIPDYQTVMLPLLQFASDKKDHSLKEAIEHLCNHFKMTPEERGVLLPSGTQEVINNRVGWARTYLKKASLVEDPKRGYFRITKRGEDFLDTKPKEITVKTLYQFQEFKEFHHKANDQTLVAVEQVESGFATPEEALDYGFSKINESLAGDILESISACSPLFFEKLVVELLVKMGYGGSRQEAGEVLGKSGDEGIDGIIKEDKLGLDTIYIQAKRWQAVVGRPEIQKFVGALAGKRAKKGIFITTSWFTDEAEKYATNIESKVVLINGERLAQLMIENNLGVSTTKVIEVKRLDSDYFVE